MAKRRRSASQEGRPSTPRSPITPMVLRQGYRYGLAHHPSDSGLRIGADTTSADLTVMALLCHALETSGFDSLLRIDGDALWARSRSNRHITGFSGALGGTRTPTILLTATSRQRVYQFRHERLENRHRNDAGPDQRRGM